jgi:hypothetical protein
LNDEGIFISVIIGNDTHDAKPHPGVKGLCAMVTPSYLSMESFKMGGFHGLAQKFLSNSSSSTLRKNRKGDDMSFGCKDDIAPDLLSLSCGGSGIDKEVLRIEGMEMKEGHAVVGRFGKGLVFDVKNGVEV